MNKVYFGGRSGEHSDTLRRREREEDGKREENQTKCELLVIRGALVSKHFV